MSLHSCPRSTPRWHQIGRMPNPRMEGALLICLQDELDAAFARVAQAGRLSAPRMQAGGT
jgi:hypothetical protein